MTTRAPLLIPPMPPRLPEGTPLWRKLLKTRGNLVAGWTEDCFERRLFDFKILNQRYIVCNDGEYVRHVFLDHHANYDRKSPQMRQALTPLLGDGLFVSDGDLWRERRNSCAPAMRSELLPLFVPRIAETAAQMADEWAEQDGTTIDALREMARLTARIIGRTIFGDDTPAAEAEQVVQGFSLYQKSIEQMDLASSLGLPSLTYLSNPLLMRGRRKAIREIHGVIDRIIERHRAKPNRSGSRTDLLGLFLDDTGNASPNGDTGCPLSNAAARNEAIVMFMAGHETTANTLTWAWYLLAASPKHAAMLHAELDEVLGGRLPNLADLPRLPFTRAIIEETLRLYPPVPVLSRQARGPDQIAKQTVHPDDIILVVPWLLHRHDKHWEDPNAFRPERFMPGAKRPDRFVYVPFSVGHRVCLGQRFGLTEAILCLAILAQRFELILDNPEKVEVSCRLTLRPAGGLPATIRSRRPGTKTNAGPDVTGQDVTGRDMTGHDVAGRDARAS